MNEDVKVIYYTSWGGANELSISNKVKKLTIPVYGTTEYLFNLAHEIAEVLGVEVIRLRDIIQTIVVLEPETEYDEDDCMMFIDEEEDQDD
jgi:hypothetical protein